MQDCPDGCPGNFAKSEGTPPKVVAVADSSTQTGLLTFDTPKRPVASTMLQRDLGRDCPTAETLGLPVLGWELPENRRNTGEP